jgi:nucleotide-binding universal stress UspA family protein
MDMVTQRDADAQRVRMKAYLEAVAQPIRDAGFKARTEVLTGDPAATIINLVKKTPLLLVSGEE